MKKLFSILGVLVTILIPFFLIMTSARIIMNPFFLDYEYNLSNFPPDEFGFTTQDRLHWGKISMNYLFNREGIEFLQDLNFSDGSALYNDRELSHMLDVKVLVQAALKVWYAIIAFLFLTGVFAQIIHARKKFWRAVSVGGWLTIFLILLGLAAILIDFDALFRDFHAIFFQADTWLFYIDDTLIRLFPEKLWSDAFTFVGVFTLVGAVLCGILGQRISQKSN
jgi:integral membrane protein (TIGR01906 family)